MIDRSGLSRCDNDSFRSFVLVVKEARRWISLVVLDQLDKPEYHKNHWEMCIKAEIKASKVLRVSEVLTNGVFDW